MKLYRMPVNGSWLGLAGGLRVLIIDYFHMYVACCSLQQIATVGVVIHAQVMGGHGPSKVGSFWIFLVR